METDDSKPKKVQVTLRMDPTLHERLSDFVHDAGKGLPPKKQPSADAIIQGAVRGMLDARTRHPYITLNGLGSSTAYDEVGHLGVSNTTSTKCAALHKTLRTEEGEIELEFNQSGDQDKHLNERMNHYMKIVAEIISGSTPEDERALSLLLESVAVNVRFKNGQRGEPGSTNQGTDEVKELQDQPKGPPIDSEAEVERSREIGRRHPGGGGNTVPAPRTPRRKTS